MAWKQRGQPKNVKITAKLAQEWSAMEAAHVDRGLSDVRLEFHKRILDKGEFRPVTWAKAHVAATGKTVRVNGKHTSHLFSIVDLDKCQPLTAIIEEYDCDTMADVAKLYSTFDARYQMRSTSDINRAYAAASDDLVGLDPRTIDLLVGGLAFAKWPDTEGRVSSRGSQATDRAELLYANIDFCTWFNDLAPRGEVSMHIRRAPVVGAMAMTYRKTKAGADQFWKLVRDDAGATPDTPDRKLAKFLHAYRVSTGANRSPKRWRVSGREFYAKCVIAWNAWRKGESTQLHYVHAAKSLPVPV